MSDETRRRVDAIRARSSELENHLIDEYRSGGLSRREFVRRSTVAGMSLSLAGFLASACGGDEGGGGGGGQGAAGDVKPGGTLRIGIEEPSTALEPLTVADQGGLATLGQTGEYLAFSNNKLQLEPRVAESWKPNADGTEWTFKIRQGQKFHNGKPLEAEDVAATFNRLADPKNKSNALSATTGVLTKDSAKATDPTTVVFSLEAPTGQFPYITSSDNYNAIILPRDYDGDWEKTFIGSAAWKLERYRQGQGATLVPFPEYPGPTPKPKAQNAELKYYRSEQAWVTALQGGEVDVVAQYSASGGKALLTDPNVKTIETRAAQHRQVHMRVDREPFQDPRVRQAVALLINRRNLVDGLFEGKADLGNDSPFAPVYPYTDKSIPQRQQDVAKAKQLLAAAGKSGGFNVTLDTHDFFELPDLAALIQNDLKQAGINVKLRITDSSTYYEKYWLSGSDFGITEYGHRGVPNVYLKAVLTSEGTWNAPHIKNKQLDRAIADFTAALTPADQKAAASKVQKIILEETPLIIPYFYYFLTGVRSNVGGVTASPMGHVELEAAGFTA